MSVVKIESQIQEWMNDPDSQDDYFSQITIYLKEFQTLTGLDKYISDDAELYYDIQCYIELLENISEITKPEIRISDIEGKSENKAWEFNFKINGEPKQIKMNDPDSDWLREEFIDLLNSCMEGNGSIKKLKMVWATSEHNTDQCFDLAFINEETFEALVNHSPRYAYLND